MSYNSVLTAVEERGQPAVPINELVDETLITIFSNCRQDLGRIACVNKRWNAITKGQPLYRELYRLINPTGRADWIAQNFGDPGREPRIPLEWLAKFEMAQDSPITLIPKKVVRNGKEISITLRSIGEIWAEKMAITEPQSRPGYTNDSWGNVFDQSAPDEETHWIWIKGNQVIGCSKCYEDQEIEAHQKGGEISGLLDTAVMMFIIHSKTGRKYVAYDRSVLMTTMVRIRDMIERVRICVGFASTGLYVFFSYAVAVESIGVLAVRKSFGE